MQSLNCFEPRVNDAVIHWLLDSDPSIRWQVMRDLTDSPEGTIAAERNRVAVDGWGARLLRHQSPSGNWGGGPWVFQSWTSTLETLTLLRELGLNPKDSDACKAISLVRDNSDWGSQHGHAPFLEGEVEPCINGRVLACGAYFGEVNDKLVDRLLADQLPDGGWNCESPKSNRSSFNSTICVLEGLLEYEKAKGYAAAVSDARRRGQEFLLARNLFRCLKSGQPIEHDRKSGHDWRDFSFPTRWCYDILWGLDYLQRAGVTPDERVNDAIGLLLDKQQSDGRWLLGKPHIGDVFFEMEGDEGSPSRWNTLRALRVLKWYFGRNPRISESCNARRASRGVSHQGRSVFARPICVLITGMSGTGKSTVTESLIERGFHAIDLDTPEWSEWIPVEGNPTGANPGFDWMWRGSEIDTLLAAPRTAPLFVSGCASNMTAYYDYFDAIVLLHVPVDIMLDRLANRSSNGYGKSAPEIEPVLANTSVVEPLLRYEADITIDTQLSVDDVVNQILSIA